MLRVVLQWVLQQGCSGSGEMLQRYAYIYEHIYTQICAYTHVCLHGEKGGEIKIR